MEEIIKSVSEKISSYNLFNNFCRARFFALWLMMQHDSV